MERAILHGDEISLSKIEADLVSKSFEHSQILDYIRGKYRVFSKKGSFKCVCCQETVYLVTPDHKQLHFRHKDSLGCAYSHNTDQYDKATRTHENENRKRVAKVVFEEILRGNLAPFGIKLEPGTMYKKALDYVPDFILTFPFSQHKWVIDYFTGFENGVKRRGYYDHLEKRLQSYAKEGFRSFPFIDKKWMAIDDDTKKGTLLSAETLLIRKGRVDKVWDDLLQNQLSKAEFDFLCQHYFHLKVNVQPNVHSLIYVDLDNRKCTIYRETDLFSDENTSTIYILDERKIPLERALTLNSEQDDFMLYQDNELEDIERFKDAISSNYLSYLEQLKKEEEERKARELERKKLEEIEKRRRDEEALNIQNEKVSKPSTDDYTGQQKYNYKTNGYSSFSEVTPQHNDPPIKVWEDFAKAQGIYEEYQIQLPAELERRNRLKKRLNEILSKRIDGETWIKGNAREWKQFAYERLLHDQNLSIDILLNEMKKQGFVFMQPDKIVRNVVKSFLDFFEKK